MKGKDTTTGLHFGGFLEKGKGTDVHKSGKDVMDEIVAKSKQLKVNSEVHSTATYLENVGQISRAAVQGIISYC